LSVLCKIVMLLHGNEQDKVYQKINSLSVGYTCDKTLYYPSDRFISPVSSAVSVHQVKFKGSMDGLT